MQKRQLILQAYDDLGYANYDFDMHPEMLSSGLTKLDNMITEWSGGGINLAYQLGAGMNEESGIPDIYNNAVISNLAIRLAGSIGKKIPAYLPIQAMTAMNFLIKGQVKPREQQMPVDFPLGAGHRTIYNRQFASTPTPRLNSDGEGGLWQDSDTE